MGNTAITTVMDRLIDAENAMVSGKTRAQIERELAKKWGISRRRASDYIRHAYARWEAEGVASREEKRAQLRAALWADRRVALSKKRSVVDNQGNPHEFDDPDVRSSLSALDMLAKLDALMDQPEASGPQGEWHDRALVVLHKHYFGNAPQELAEGERDAIDATPKLRPESPTDAPRGGEYARGEHKSGGSRQ